jgi:hypothetical protein
MRRLAFLIFLAAAATGCATTRDRCYIEDARFDQMRALFEQTGSIQRVRDAMKDEQWAACERNEFEYRLRKELLLNEEDFAHVPPGKEPQFDRNPHAHQH